MTAPRFPTAPGDHVAALQAADAALAEAQAQITRARDRIAVTCGRLMA